MDEKVYEHLPATMTIEQVAHELQLERHTAMKIIETSIPYIRLTPKCIRIPRHAFLEFLENASNKKSRTGE